jgi:hypothetical protein
MLQMCYLFRHLRHIPLKVSPQTAKHAPKNNSIRTSDGSKIEKCDGSGHIFTTTRCAQYMPLLLPAATNAGARKPRIATASIGLAACPTYAGSQLLPLICDTFEQR